MRQLHSYFLLLMVLFASDGVAQWNEVLPLGYELISDVRFLENDDKVAFGLAAVIDAGQPSSTIYISNDGGMSWMISPTGTFNSQIWSIAIKDSKTAWVGSSFPSPGRYSLYKTNDGGLTWAPLAIQCQAFALYYNQSSKRLFLTDAFAVYYSDDEGISWNSITMYNGIDFQTGYAFTDSFNGIFSGGSTGTPLPIYQTKDAGVNWNPVVVVDELYQPLAIKRTTTYFGVSEITNNVIRSDDGGITWDTVYTFPFKSQISGTIVGDFCHLYVQSNNEGTYESLDEGKSWKLISDLKGFRDTRFYYNNNVLFVGGHPTTSPTNKNGSLWRYDLPPNKPTMAVDDKLLSPPPCSDIDTLLLFAAVNQCDGDKVILDTLYTTGSPNFTISHDPIGREIVWDTLGVTYTPTGNTEDTAFVHFRFKLKGNYFDTVMTIRGKGSNSGDSVSFTPRFAESGVTAGGVTNLAISPSRSVAGKGLSEILVNVSYNGDILERVSETTEIPNANITVAGETVSNGMTTTTLRITGADLTLDPSQAAASIRFRTYLSDTTITAINLSTINFNPQNPDYERCTLSARASDTTFALTLLCGDSLISRHLGGKPILTITSIKPNPARDEVRIDVVSAADELAVVKVMDISGKVMLEQMKLIKAGNQQVTIDTKKLAEGSYVIELRGTGGATQAKVLIQR